MKTLMISALLLLLCSFLTPLEGKKFPRKVNLRELACTSCTSSESSQSSAYSSAAAVIGNSTGGNVQTMTSSSFQSSSTTSARSYSRAEASREVSVSPSPVPKKTAPKVHEPTPMVYKEEKSLTERVREAILNANIVQLSELLVENDQIKELALGFTFSPDLRDEYLFETEYRFTDPDVTSLKGMARAAIIATQQASKLTEIFIDAIHGLNFDSNLCPEPSPSPKPSRDHFKRGQNQKMGSIRVSAMATTYSSKKGRQTYNFTSPSVSQYPKASENKTADCEEPTKAVPEPVASGPESNIPECYTPEEIKTIRSNLLEDFNNLDLMNEILYADPRTESRRLMRRLLVIGTPVDSWLCADCWKPRFCNKNAWWCPPQ